MLLLSAIVPPSTAASSGSKINGNASNSAVPPSRPGGGLGGGLGGGVGGGLGGGLGGGTSFGGGGGSLSQRTVFPISSLSPYQSKWTIRVRVASKPSIRTWSNSRGEGRVFNVDLVDESVSEAGCVCDVGCV